MKQITFTSLILVLFLFQSCIKNNPDPSWLEINEWMLNTNPIAQNAAGELTQDISNVQIFIDNELVGIFELPCKIPLLKSGSSNIKLYPVILNNGISATKKVYPFLEPFTIDTLLKKNEILTLSPQTQYYYDLEFWIEDFENASSSITQDINSAVVLEQTYDNLIAEGFNGNKFGRISINEVNDTWVGYTLNQEFTPPKGKEVYLEIDYHNTNRITTGLLAVGSGGNQENPNIQLNPQSDSEVKWKKVYIDLKEIVSGSQDVSYFELTFNALLDEEDSQGEINIDNVKMIHF